MNKKRSTPGWFGLYTAMLLLCVGTIVLIALIWKKTLVWNPDGVKQVYTVMGYVGKTVRNLLAGKGLPMMSYSLGQGMDALTTTTFYGYTDPLNLIGALFAGDGIEIGYAIATFLRMYLAGAFLGLYVRRVGVKDGWALSCAALIYACSGYVLRMVARHPHFINGAIYLPLLLIAIERVLKNRRWLMYVMVTALMLCVNFYFGYMNTLTAVIYIVVRLLARLRKRGVRESVKDGLILLGGYLLGLAVSAVVMLPVIQVYISNSRLGVEAGYQGSLWYYFTGYYISLATLMFAPWDSPGNFTALNFVPVALPALMALLFIRSSRARQVRIALLLCAVGACVPAIGKLYNGMGYVSNRWFYVVALFVALGCALGLDRLQEPRFRYRRLIGALSIGFAGLLAVFFTYKRLYILLAAPALLIPCATLLLTGDHGGPAAWQARFQKWLGTVLAVSCIAYAAVGFLPIGYDAIGDQADVGLYTRVESEAVGSFIGQESAFRVSQSGYDDAHSAMLGYMGTSYYWSLVDAENSRYYMDLQLPTQAATYHLDGLGAGAAMNAVAAVKYFVRHEGMDAIVPYGFEPAGDMTLPDGRRAQLYENRLALPLGYCYDACLTTEAYEALPVEHRLQALTRFAIVDSADADRLSLPKGRYEGDAIEADWTLSELSDTTWEGECLSVQAGGNMRLALDAPDDGEIYLLIEGLELVRTPNDKDAWIHVRSSSGVSSFSVPNPVSNFYFPKKNMAVCLGYGAMDEIILTFDNTAEYRLGGLRVVSLPIRDYESDMRARRGETLNDLALSNDWLKGKVVSGGKRVLQIAVPYSTGWSAWVDGERRSVFRCGGMYMGIALEAGEHDVELRYVTPGLKTGMRISAVAVVLAFLLAAVDVMYRRRVDRKRVQTSFARENERR